MLPTIYGSSFSNVDVCRFPQLFYDCNLNITKFRTDDHSVENDGHFSQFSDSQQLAAGIICRQSCCAKVSKGLPDVNSVIKGYMRRVCADVHVRLNLW